MVPVIRTPLFDIFLVSLGVSALLEQPCLQHSLHALPNKLLGKSTRCNLSMKEYFSIVCSINRTSCRAVVCDKHVPLWPLQMRPAPTSSFLVFFCSYFYVHVLSNVVYFPLPKNFETEVVRWHLFGAVGRRGASRFCFVTWQTQCAVTSLEAGGVVQ